MTFGRAAGGPGPGRWTAPAGPRTTASIFELPALLALGGLQTVAHVHTGAWALTLAAIAVLAGRVARVRPRRAALLGMAFGMGWIAADVWWLFISMHRYGGLPAWMAAAAVLLLAGVLSLYLAAAMAAFAHWRRGRAAGDALLLGALWLLAEWARGVLFTGFPWGATGYALVDSPLAGLAPWVGVYGMGAVAAGLGALVASPRGGPGVGTALGTTTWRRAAGPVAAGGLLLAMAVAPVPDFTRSTGALSVTLLQTNVAQDEKFAVEHLPAALEWVAGALRDARGELVVAPETAIPLLPGQLAEFDPAYWPALRARFEQGGQAAQAALLGLPLGDYDAGYTNSVVGLSAATAGRTPYRYDKVHLVPFGEFIPTGFRWFTTLMNIPLGDFTRGSLDAPSFPVRGQRVAPNICYEDLFGEELARRFADPARAPTLMANVSNIGWFGDTIADDQHLQISRLRTLELQRPMIRATNTGATAAIDHRGKVVAELPPFTRGVLDARVDGREGTTPYAWWTARAGLWPLLAAALLVVVQCARRAGRAAAPGAP